jgi:hypothetical protein
LRITAANNVNSYKKKSRSAKNRGKYKPCAYRSRKKCWRSVTKMMYISHLLQCGRSLPGKVKARVEAQRRGSSYRHGTPGKAEIVLSRDQKGKTEIQFLLPSQKSCYRLYQPRRGRLFL